MRGPYYKLDEEERAEIQEKLKRRKALLDELSGLTNKAISIDYGCSAEVVRCMFNEMISGEWDDNQKRKSLRFLQRNARSGY